MGPTGRRPFTGVWSLARLPVGLDDGIANVPVSTGRSTMDHPRSGSYPVAVSPGGGLGGPIVGAIWSLM
jgi:hypothetical protein